jgi:MFS family permease
MARVNAELVLAGGSAAALMCPRDGIVLEAVDGKASDGTFASFRQAEGPLASYRRTVEVEPLGGDQYRARQVVELTVGLPWWSWLLALPLRHSLGKARVGAVVRRTSVRGTSVRGASVGGASVAGVSVAGASDTGALEAGALATGALEAGALEAGARMGESRHEVRLPWWAPPQRLDRRQATVMATLAAIVSVQGFLATLLPETLTYAASEMHVRTFGQGVVFASVELSALPALLALVLADRRGRRSVVLWATGGAAVLSELGGFAPSIVWLTVTQVAAGALLAAAGIAAIVMAVEEVPRGCRAWAVGVLGLAGGFGGGVPLLLLPLAGTSAGGWRWLYWLSLLSLPLVALCAQQLPESRRWVAAETAEHRGGESRSPVGPVMPVVTGATVEAGVTVGTGATVEAGVTVGPRKPVEPGMTVEPRVKVGARRARRQLAPSEPVGPELWTGHESATGPGVAEVGRGSLFGWARSSLAPHLRSPAGRLVLVCAGAVLFALFASPASQFQTEFLRQERHYSALDISVLQQVAGTIGAFGVLVGGRLADTHGRRPVAVVCVAGATAATLWTYLAHGWLMWIAATSGQFFLYATAPVLGVYGAELFATTSRARSAGLVAASSAVGGVSGLLAVGALAGHFGTLGPALAALAVGPLLLVILLLIAYPETAGVTLEDLAPSPRGMIGVVAPGRRSVPT